MSVLPLLPDQPDDPAVRAMFDEVTTRWPHVPNLYRVLGHAPDMLRAWLDMAWPLRLKPTTSRRLRELIILHLARSVRSGYEWAHHVPLALEAGVLQSEIDALEAGEMPDSLAAAEQAALTVAGEIAAGPEATPEAMAGLEPYFDPSEIVEIVLTASFYVCVARVIGSLQVPLEERHAAPW